MGIDKKVSSNIVNIRHKIAVMSGKGGVGKSTVCTNIAWAMATQGKAVGLLDADIHGPNVPAMLGIADKQFTAQESGTGDVDDVLVPVSVLPNLHVASVANIGYDKDTALIWRGPMKLGLIKQFLSDIAWGSLDYLLIDTPPGTGDEALTIGQYIKPMTGIVIVTTPQDVALLDSRKSVDFARQMKIPVMGIVENMADGVNMRMFGMGGGERSAQELKVPFLGRISLDAEIIRASDVGMPYIAEHNESEAGKQIKKVVEKILAYCEGADNTT